MFVRCVRQAHPRCSHHLRGPRRPRPPLLLFPFRGATWIHLPLVAILLHRNPRKRSKVRNAMNLDSPVSPWHIPRYMYEKMHALGPTNPASAGDPGIQQPRLLPRRLDHPPLSTESLLFNQSLRQGRGRENYYWAGLLGRSPAGVIVCILDQRGIFRSKILVFYPLALPLQQQEDVLHACVFRKTECALAMVQQCTPQDQQSYRFTKNTRHTPYLHIIFLNPAFCLVI